MIKNKRQYQVSKDQLSMLSRALEDARKAPKPNALAKAHIQALETQIRTIAQEISEYERLIEKPFDPAPLQAIENIGREIIRARIACGLTHRELAILLGKQEQAIQRLEAGDYGSASLSTVAMIAKVLIVAPAGE